MRAQNVQLNMKGILASIWFYHGTDVARKLLFGMNYVRIWTVLSRVKEFWLELFTIVHD